MGLMRQALGKEVPAALDWLLSLNTTPTSHRDGGHATQTPYFFPSLFTEATPHASGRLQPNKAILQRHLRCSTPQHQVLPGQNVCHTYMLPLTLSLLSGSSAMPTYSSVSRRPGRSRAGSSRSGRLVAPTTNKSSPPPCRQQKTPRVTQQVAKEAIPCSLEANIMYDTGGWAPKESALLGKPFLQPHKAVTRAGRC